MCPMKNFRLILATCLLCASAVLGNFPAESVSAHTLLPKKLMEYMEQHQTATEQEIEDFMAQDPAMYDDNSEYKAKIIEQVRNPVPGTFWNNCWDFFLLGIDHILSGLDHILFVLSLVLFFTTLGNILKLISMFTIAHSITLILAGTDLLRVSSAIVEPMIAFSIAYVAITSVFLRRYDFFASNRNKMIGVFCFGLFHGMGFAGLLHELAIPDDKFLSTLVSFNLGIEAGQICILAIALPFIFFFRKKRWYQHAMKIFAVIISTIAIIWVIERLMGS